MGGTIQDWTGRGHVDNDNFHDRHTKHFVADPSVGWSFAIATLERLNKWSVDALRLGTLLLLQQCIRAMAAPGGDKKALLARSKELIAALDHLPWNETPPAPALSIIRTVSPPRTPDR
jgi:hypothetical protein